MAIDFRGLLGTLGCRDLLPSEWYGKIAAWDAWYRGKTDFHTYYVPNGQRRVKCERMSLGMAKKVCEDKADLLLNEKVTITAGDEAAQAYLDKVLDNSDFWTQGNQLLERANALGTGAFVEIKDTVTGEVSVNYVPATHIYPLSWHNSRIMECAFVSHRRSAKDGTLYYINRHLLVDGQYTVYNNLFDEHGVAVPLPDGVLDEWATGSDRPLFQIVTPNIVNNLSNHNPMGISVYANHIDILKALDAVFDSYHNEFTLGRKRIFADATLLHVNMDEKDGKPRPVFDPNDTVFYNIPGMNADAANNNNPIRESNMTLRVVEHQQALQAELDLLSENVGFGKGYYKFDVDNVQTATAVISQNSKLYRKIRKDEIVLEKALTDMARAVLFLGGLSPEAEISVNFDDSIIEDTNAIANRAMLEHSAGIIDDVEYFKRVYKLEEDAAQKLVNEIQARRPQEPDMTGLGMQPRRTGRDA